MRALALILALGPLAAPAQDAATPAPPPTPPAAAPAPPPAQWKAQAKAGLVSTGGNAQTTTLTGAANVSRTDALNKVAFDGSVAYGQSGLIVAQDRNGNGLIERGEVGRDTQTTANAWAVKARYDRFITAMNGAFVAAGVGADIPAGKDVIGGAQAGWAAKLVKTPTQELVAELGYDFSYEEYAAPGTEATEIHSARAFVGETLKLNDAVGFAISLEALVNLNEEKAPDSRRPARRVQAWDDVRLNGKAALTAALRKNVSLSVGFAVRWDRNPAPLAPIAGATFSPVNPPFAREVDTVTDAALIVTFL